MTTSSTDAFALDPDSPGYYRRLPWQVSDGTSISPEISTERFAPTLHAQGAWQAHEQHMSPVAALMLQSIESHLAARGGPEAGLQIARVTYEILGMVAARPVEVSVEVVRPGRTIAVVEAALSVDGRVAVRARAWLLGASDTASVAGGQPEPMPAPDTFGLWENASAWGGGYIDSLQARVDPASEPGHVRAWLTTERSLIADETHSDLALFVGLVDTANGMAARESPHTWMFPNTELTVHLYRTPAGRWLGLDVTAVFGATGVGLTSAVLFDTTGPVGRSEQILTVRPMPQR